MANYRQADEVPSIFAIALETMAVKTFGDMGQTSDWLATQISSKVGPGGGGGAARITVPREGVDIETRNLSVSPVVRLQSVSSLVSVVLVEETEVRCAERLASVPVDKDVRLLAEVAYPACDCL